MLCLNQAHHQTLSRAAKQTIDDVANVLPRYIATAYHWRVKVRAVLQRPLYLAFAMQDVGIVCTVV